MLPRLCRHPGFTLVEILLVIAVMAILAGIVLPRSDPGIHDQLRAAARVLAADLAYARSLAVTHGRPYRVVFAVGGGQYVIEPVSGGLAGGSPGPSASQAATDRQTVVLGDLPGIGPTVRIAAAVTKGAGRRRAGEVEFGPLGETRGPGPTTIWLAAGRGRTQWYVPLEVHPITGLVQIGPLTGGPPPAWPARPSAPGASVPAGPDGRPPVPRTPLPAGTNQRGASARRPPAGPAGIAR